MPQGDTIVRFDKVSFLYGPNRPILQEVSFSLRRGAKMTLMGQNGAGKTTIFSLIAGSQKSESGEIYKDPELSIATARQVIPREELGLTIRDFFQARFKQKVYDIDPKIDDVLEIVNLQADHERIIKSFSGGQQARLLLASALIQKPELLLLDEPTNNLDKEGIAHLRQFLVDYPKTVIVISHDADFLNAFTQGVLYLDAMRQTVEQYQGNYFNVVKDISARIEKENRINAQLAKEIQENKDQANVFSHKGGQMRLVARRMRDKAEELEEAKVVVRKEDKAIRPFTIPLQSDIGGEILNISSVTILKGHKLATRKVNISLRKGQHLLLLGPNGIGKSSLLESIVKNTAKGVTLAPGINIGYYSQDFSTLNFDQTVYEALASTMKDVDEQKLRSTAASFLISAESVKSKIGSLSEGQKGLVSFARLVLLQPGLLLLDEPTNHMNFRHIPVIAEALTKFEGPMILISHAPDFVKQIRIDDILDLGK